MQAAPRGPLTPPHEVDLEIIVPALNEESRIARAVDALADQVEQLPVSGRIRVIDNGSADRTADVVDLVGASRDVPISVEGCSRPGKARAVARGVLTARSRWVGYCDAGVVLLPSALSAATGYLDEGWPLVTGSRRGCGFKLFDRDVARRIVLATVAQGPRFDRDVMEVAKGLGHPVKEVAVEAGSPDGRVRPDLSAIGDAWRMARARRRGLAG